MKWFTKLFICTEKTVEVIKNNDFIIDFLKEVAQLSENSVDDSVIQFVQFLLDAKSND